MSELLDGDTLFYFSFYYFPPLLGKVMMDGKQ